MITKFEHFARRSGLPSCLLLSLALLAFGNVYKSLAADAGNPAPDAPIPQSEGALVEVTVVSTNEMKPFADATVSAWQSTLHTNMTAYTDANGIARFRLQPGNNWISAFKRDWSPQNATTKVEEGITNRLTIRLIPAPRITGIVHDPSGAPAPDVLVSFHPGQFPGASDYSEVRTDENGRYELILQREPAFAVFWDGPINPTNFVLARDYRRNLATIQEFASIQTNLDLVLQPGITLSGSVRDTNGAPITNATVKLSILSSHFGVALDPQPAKVDARGAFSFPALPQGRDYDLFNGITAAGYGTAFGRLEAKNSKTNHYEFSPFVLRRADGILAGRVLDADGKPIAGANVRFNGSGQREWASTKSDDKGHFVFDSVCEGDVQVSGNWNGPPGSGIFMNSNQGGGGAKTRAGDTNIVIVLRDPDVQANAGPILFAGGTVFDPSGAPCRSATMHVWRSANPFMSAFTDGAGKYNIRWQRQWSSPGAPKFSPCVVARAVSRNLVGIRGLDETTTNLDIRLQIGGILSGHVQDTNGTPMANASVTLDAELNYASAQLDGTQTDAQGAFSFQALPPAGNYTLRVNATGYGPVFMMGLRVDASQSNHLELPPVSLKEAKLRVAGRVIDPAGKPVPGIWLQITGPHQAFLQPPTDADGRFSCGNLVEGQVRIFASRSAINGGPSLRANVVTKAGDTNIVVQLNPWDEK
jgi:protocatechuate 3,4-dioxygenase beta subunit